MGRYNLQRRPVEGPGWFARLFGRPQPTVAAARIWNLVAGASIADIRPEQIAEMLTTSKVRPADLAPDLRQLYTAVLYEACRDADLSEGEVDDLRRLKALLSLSDADVAEVASAVYKSHLGSALKDEDLGVEERSRLATLADALRLPADVAAAAMKQEGGALLQRVLDRAISDRRLAPEEEAQLYALAKQLGVTPSIQGETAAALDRFRLYWRIEQGDLPQIEVRINLKRGEQCHFRTPVTHLERRSVTRAIAYAGPTASIRIAKGVRFRLGAIAPHRITEEVLAPLDTGVLYITNRRLLFDGGRQSRTFELSKIINFTPYRDGLAIERDRGKDQMFQFEGDVELAAMILGAALARA